MRSREKHIPPNLWFVVLVGKYISPSQFTMTPVFPDVTDNVLRHWYKAVDPKLLSKVTTRSAAGLHEL